jgi:hypothetical protein
MGDILKTLVTTPVPLLLLLAALGFLFIAAVGNIAGKIEPGKIGRFISGIIGVFLLVLSFGTANSQQIPSGTYQGTCQNNQIKGETLISACYDIQRQLRTTELPGFKDCKGDISNHNGKLECSK